MPIIRLTATGKPSPGIVTLPQRTSSAMPKPKILQPTTWAIACITSVVGANHCVNHILRSISEPKTKPTNNWKSWTASNCRRKTSIWPMTSMKFIMYVYCPMVNENGNNWSLLASEKTKGKTLITLEPSMERIQTATPTVIIHNDTKSKRCCQQKEMILSFIYYLLKCHCKVNILIALLGLRKVFSRMPNHTLSQPCHTFVTWV